MVAEFEWLKTKLLGIDEETWVDFWYFVDPSGQVRADIEGPVNGRLAYVVDRYWTDATERFISLSLAKSHVEMSYAELLKTNSRKQKRTKPRDLQKTQTNRHRRGPAEKGNGLG